MRVLIAGLALGTAGCLIVQFETHRDAAAQAAPAEIDLASATRANASATLEPHAKDATLDALAPQGTPPSTRVLVPQGGALFDRPAAGLRKRTNFWAPAACDHDFATFRDAVRSVLVSSRVRPHLEGALACQRNTCQTFPAQFLKVAPNESSALIRGIAKHLAQTPDLPETARQSLALQLPEWAQTVAEPNRLDQARAVRSPAILVRVSELDAYIALLKSRRTASLLAANSTREMRDPACVLGLFDLLVEHKRAAQAMREQVVHALESANHDSLPEPAMSLPANELFTSLIHVTRTQQDPGLTPRLEELAVEPLFEFAERKQIWSVLFATPQRDLIRDVRFAIETCVDRFEPQRLVETAWIAALERSDLSRPDREQIFATLNLIMDAEIDRVDPKRALELNLELLVEGW